LTTLASAISHK